LCLKKSESIRPSACSKIFIFLKGDGILQSSLLDKYVQKFQYQYFTFPVPFKVSKIHSTPNESSQTNYHSSHRKWLFLFVLTIQMFLKQGLYRVMTVVEFYSVAVETQ